MLVPMAISASVSGSMLVKITNKYESGLATNKEKYDFVGEGEAVSCATLDEFLYETVKKKILGHKIYFEEITPYIIRKDDGEYFFIDVKTLKGYEDER